MTEIIEQTPKTPPFVWCVVFSNYDPAEVNSIHETEEGASTEAEALDGDWCVEKWQVKP